MLQAGIVDQDINGLTGQRVHHSLNVCFASNINLECTSLPPRRGDGLCGPAGGFLVHIGYYYTMTMGGSQLG